jgi:hypothetical protein
MTIKKTAFINKQYAVIHQVHIGILGTGWLFGDVKICCRVTVIDQAALFQDIYFFYRSMLADWLRIMVLYRLSLLSQP